MLQNLQADMVPLTERYNSVSQQLDERQQEYCTVQADLEEHVRQIATIQDQNELLLDQQQEWDNEIQFLQQKAKNLQELNADLAGRLYQIQGKQTEFDHQLEYMEMQRNL